MHFNQMIMTLCAVCLHCPSGPSDVKCSVHFSINVYMIIDMEVVGMGDSNTQPFKQAMRPANEIAGSTTHSCSLLSFTNSDVYLY